MSTSSNTDFDGLDEDDETVALKLKQEKDVIQMLRKNADMVLDELSNNSNSLIDEYINSKSSFMNTNTNKDCAYDASYFKRLHVDMTKFRVVYPDWSTSKHAEYHSGRILKCDVTRVGDRIYDVVCTEHTKGFRQNKATGMTTKIPNVREEYIRIAASQMQLKSHSSHNKGHLTVGIRVFALVPEKHSRSGHHAREQYYYPGTVERVKNSTYDIRMQHSGKLVEGLTVDDILTNGLLVDQEIETKKPNIPELQCTSCTWNGTGSSIAVSYGQTTNINGWCNVPGCVAIWNLNSRSFDPNAPTYLLDYPSAITTVKFHPEKPSIVVAGTVNGEVIVWDLTEQTTVVNVLTSSSDDAVYGTNKETSGGLKMNSKHDTLSVDPVCISVIDEFSHKEPIMDLQWLMSNSSITNHVHSHMKSKTKYVQNKLILPDSYILTSIAADGKVRLFSNYICMYY